MRKISETAYRFDVDTDISAFAITQAYDFLKQKINPEYDPKISIYWELEVASQNFEACFVFVYFCHANIHLNTKYKEDEWSLNATWWAWDDKKSIHPAMKVMKVWSPGA